MSCCSIKFLHESKSENTDDQIVFLEGRMTLINLDEKVLALPLLHKISPGPKICYLLNACTVLVGVQCGWYLNKFRLS